MGIFNRLFGGNPAPAPAAPSVPDRLNPQLAAALIEISQEDSAQHRQLLYQRLLPSPLLVETPDPAPDEPTQQRVKGGQRISLMLNANAAGDKVLFAYTHVAAMQLARGIGTSYIALAAPKLFELVQLNPAEIDVMLDPMGPHSCRIPRKHFTDLAAGRLPDLGQLEALAMGTPADIKHNPAEDRIPFYRQLLKSRVLVLRPSGAAARWDLIRWGELDGHPVLPIFSSLDNFRAFADANRARGLPSCDIVEEKGAQLFSYALMADYIVLNPESKHPIAFTLGQVAYHAVDKRVFHPDFDTKEFHRAVDRIVNEE